MNSRCNEVQLLLVEYSAGDLPSDQTRIVESHLKSCSECQEELRRELRLRGLLSSLPTLTLPLPGSRSEHDLPLRGAWRRTFLGRWILPAAGVAAVLLAVFFAPNFPSGDFLDLKHQSSSGSHPGQSLVQEPENISDWTRAELDTAQKEAIFSLTLTARILLESERTAVHQAFGKKLPHVISGSLRKIMNTNQGDKG
ncbi:MAG: zf-HC2 domain-containing protein [Gemmatimonadales bacterium]|nr:zf-HC2 domain-containing protein [Gemmatimonadales bacterium]